MTDTVQAAETAVVDEKKTVQNDIHPVVKSLWAEIGGNLSEFKTWIEAELKKL